MRLSDVVDRPGAKVGGFSALGALMVAILIQVSGVSADVAKLSEAVTEMQVGLAVAKSQIDARVSSLERRVGIIERDAERENEARRQRLEEYRRAMDRWEAHEGRQINDDRRRARR